ncbi:MAG: Ldh family oxidoreductase [Candidatus Latescibacteria bacterium]|nr:Ldh family oxidoreductase [Candidatus Latescibacterota bacterium]
MDPTAPDPTVRTTPGPDEQLVRVEQLRELASQVYQKVGVPKEEADLVAGLEAETDLRGVHSHGTRALPSYIRRIQEGKTNPRPAIQVVREGPSFALLEGDRGLGLLTGTRAIQMAIDKARKTGIAAVAVRNSNHFGAAANFALQALEHDMVGFAASSSSPGLAPYGGASRLVGNHPFAYAVPAGEERPLVLDMACGVSAWGRVGTMRMYGKPLADNWVLDKDGRPTNDPAQAHILLPFGSFKGYGLTMIVDALTGILPFGVSTCHRDAPEFAGQTFSSHFFYALHVESFIPLDEFKTEMDRTIRTVRSSKRAEGVDRIYLPGEIEWLKKEAWSQTGIPIHNDHINSLAQLADEFGVPVPWR